MDEAFIIFPGFLSSRFIIPSFSVGLGESLFLSGLVWRGAFENCWVLHLLELLLLKGHIVENKGLAKGINDQLLEFSCRNRYCAVNDITSLYL